MRKILEVTDHTWELPGSEKRLLLVYVDVDTKPQEEIIHNHLQAYAERWNLHIPLDIPHYL